jgi:hypothetical protein
VLLKTPKGRERLEIFAPPPYRRGHHHDSFHHRFNMLEKLAEVLEIDPVEFLDRTK